MALTQFPASSPDSGVPSAVTSSPIEMSSSGTATRVTRTGGQATITVIGEIDIGSAPELHACLEQCLAEGSTEIILDMSDMTFIDSSGLAEIAYVTRVLKLRGGRVALQKPAPTIRRLLDVVGLASFFDVLS